MVVVAASDVNVTEILPGLGLFVWAITLLATSVYAILTKIYKKYYPKWVMWIQLLLFIIMTMVAFIQPDVLIGVGYALMFIMMFCAVAAPVVAVVVLIKSFISASRKGPEETGGMFRRLLVVIAIIIGIILIQMLREALFGLKS